jgi:hypothetical protein
VTEHFAIVETARDPGRMVVFRRRHAAAQEFPSRRFAGFAEIM